MTSCPSGSMVAVIVASMLLKRLLLVSAVVVALSIFCQGFPQAGNAGNAGGSNADSGNDNMPKMKLILDELKPCTPEDAEKNIFGFNESDIWLDKIYVEIVTSISALVEIDDSLQAFVTAKVCKDGNENDCEEYPELRYEKFCNDMFQDGSVFSLMFETVDNMVTSCPIPVATYQIKGAKIPLVQSEAESAKLKGFKGTWSAQVRYMLHEKDAGCQFAAFRIVEEGKKKG